MSEEMYKGYLIKYKRTRQTTSRDKPTVITKIYRHGNTPLSNFWSEDKIKAEIKAHLWINMLLGKVSPSEYDRRIKRFLK